MSSCLWVRDEASGKGQEVRCLMPDGWLSVGPPIGMTVGGWVLAEGLQTLSLGAQAPLQHPTSGCGVCAPPQKDSPVLCWAGCVYHWGLRRHKPPVLASREPPLSGAGPLVLMSGDLPIVAPVPKWGADFPLCHFSIPSVPGGYRRAGPECLCLPVMAQQKPPPGCQDNVSEGGLFLEETVNLS